MSDKPMTADELPPVTPPAAAPSSDLGPAVTSEFMNLPGVEELLSGGGGGGDGKTKTGGERSVRHPSPDAAAQSGASAAPPAVIGSDVLRQTLVQIDQTTSMLLEIEAEEPEYMGQIADGLLPLANYYASQKPSVATLWIVGGLSVLSYAAVKWSRIRAKAASTEGASNGQTKEEG